jgi:hypothetical protein
MPDKLDLILAKRAEVEKEISLLREQIAERESQIERLDIAGKVIAELIGTEYSPTPPTDLTAKPKIRLRKRGLLKVPRPNQPKTMPEMILSALEEAQREFKVGLRPKEIHRAIIKADDPEADVGRVNAVAWRMERRGQIVKDDQSRYSLPKMDNAVDTMSREGASTALDSQAKGREAGPGGGT